MNKPTDEKIWQVLCDDGVKSASVALYRAGSICEYGKLRSSRHLLQFLRDLKPTLSESDTLIVRVEFSDDAYGRLGSIPSHFFIDLSWLDVAADEAAADFIARRCERFGFVPDQWVAA